jgi:hypothetical protein
LSGSDRRDHGHFGSSEQTHRTALTLIERRLATPPRSLVEAITWHDDAWLLKEAVRIEKRSLRWSNRATAAWLSVAREIGRMLLAMPKQAGARTPGVLRGTPRLRDLGLRKKQSHEYQLLAKIPDELFRDYCWDRIDRGIEITKAEALYIARSILDATGPNWRAPRLTDGRIVRVPVDVLWDVADAAHEAASDIAAGHEPSHALAAALDLIMVRLGGLIGRRQEWEEGRRGIERAIGAVTARRASGNREQRERR